MLLVQSATSPRTDCKVDFVRDTTLIPNLVKIRWWWISVTLLFLFILSTILWTNQLTKSISQSIVRWL